MNAAYWPALMNQGPAEPLTAHGIFWIAITILVFIGFVVAAFDKSRKW